MSGVVTLVVYAVLALVVVAALVAVAVLLLPATEQLAPAPVDRTPWALPAERAMTGPDVGRLRLPVTLRGYRFAETDAVLDRLGEEIAYRDSVIATLRAELEGEATTEAQVEVESADGVVDDEPAVELGETPEETEAAGGDAQVVRLDDELPDDELPDPRGAADVRAPVTADRCSWADPATAPPDYVAYHDDEWGRPVHGDRALFERLSLEAFQSGLSWLTILRKRPAFRAAFADFRPAVVAGFDDDDVARLLADPGIVRNRRKIAATVTNARRIADAVPEGLDALLWSFAPPARPRPVGPADVPAVTPESTAMAKELKRRGFAHVGPTTSYALMQATGMVDDHLQRCFVRS